MDTIILIGENGTGKSILLNIIYDATSFALDDVKRDEQRRVEVLLTDEEIQTLSSRDNLKDYFTNGVNGNIAFINYDFNISENWNQIRFQFKSKTGDDIKITGNLLSQNGILKSIFSDVEINFTPKELSSVTSGDVDQAIKGNVKSSGNLATEITQLLIDITNLDALEFSNWGRANVDKKVELSMLDTRMSRFKEAFKYMFPTKQFHSVENHNNQKVVQFIENGTIIPISKLSSGEKQIVFRGGFLLKDKRSNNGTVVLIDEPEISLHPRWQLKVLNFYKKLFTDDAGKQISQVFVATHSPFIIHNGNRYNDKIVVLERDSHGKTLFKEEATFFGWTAEQVVQSALKIETLATLDKPLIFVEGETDEKYFKKVIDVFNHSQQNIEVRWVGRIAESGQREFTGDSALDQTKAFLLANAEFIKSKIVLLYDSDTKAIEKTQGKLTIRKAPKNSVNTLYKRGIENLLTLPVDFAKNDFYATSVKTDEYGATKTIQELDKNKLCNWILAQSTDKMKTILTKINDLFVSIANEVEK